MHSVVMEHSTNDSIREHRLHIRKSTSPRAAAAAAANGLGLIKVAKRKREQKPAARPAQGPETRNSEVGDWPAIREIGRATTQQPNAAG
jgi:hypothetical protein